MHAKEVVFAFWTGSNPMSSYIQSHLEHMKTVFGVPLIFITEETLDAWILPTYPLHPAYPYLSVRHRADYLRCYFMHHYGGGYADIKPYFTSWAPYFKLLNTSDAYILGYREIGPDGVAILEDPVMYNKMKESWHRLIGCGCFISKPYTEFTHMWINRVNSILDTYYPILKVHPASILSDHRDAIIDGKKSSYPLFWTDVMGRPFHLTAYTYMDKLLTTLPKFEY